MLSFYRSWKIHIKEPEIIRNINLILTEWKSENEGIKISINKTEKPGKENSNFQHRVGNIELPENRISKQNFDNNIFSISASILKFPLINTFCFMVCKHCLLAFKWLMTYIFNDLFALRNCIKFKLLTICTVLIFYLLKSRLLTNLFMYEDIYEILLRTHTDGYIKGDIYLFFIKVGAANVPLKLAVFILRLL